MKRRIIWSLYAWPISLMLLASDAFAGLSYSGTTVIIFAFLDLCISFPSLVAMHLNIWDKKLFNPMWWRIYAFLSCTWDLFFNTLIMPKITGESFGRNEIIGLVILLPLYFAVFRYAFRRWETVEQPG
jgi:hypothetical protein